MMTAPDDRIMPTSAARRLRFGATLVVALALGVSQGLAAPGVGQGPSKASANAEDGLEAAVAVCRDLLERRPSPFGREALFADDAPDPFDEIQALEWASRACRDRVMFTYAHAPKRLAAALRRASLSPTISDDGRIWFVAADLVTGGSASEIDGRFYRLDGTGRLRPASERLSGPDAPHYRQILALRFGDSTQYLALSASKTCNTCYASSARILALQRGKVVDRGGFSLQYRMDDGDIEVEMSDGEAARRIAGEKGPVVVLRYRVVVEADDFGEYGWTGELDAPGGPGDCPAAKAGIAGKDAGPPADPERCALAGRVIYDGRSFSILDVNGRCAEDLSPGRLALCRSGR